LKEGDKTGLKKGGNHPLRKRQEKKYELNQKTGEGNENQRSWRISPERGGGK